MTAVKPRRAKPLIANHTALGGSNESKEHEPAVLSFTQDELAQARRELLGWYDVNHRILPWRRNASSKRLVDGTEGDAAPLGLPQQQFIYFVWVSEVMSQQTQVARAAEYFRRWVQKFPTVEALAAATEDEVNAMWAGLGYYRRARFLLAGAQYVTSELGGTFPTCAAELRKIPGVGAYTGNAIASIACHEAVAVVDANVVRVVSRLRRLASDPKSKAAVAAQTALADALLDPERPGDFNQAVMELGATVCTVHQPPSCSSCPLRAVCEAFADVQANPETAPPVKVYPAKVDKAQRREESAAVAVVTLVQPDRDDLYLLMQRPKEGLLAGLWEFPAAKVPADASKADCRRALDRLLEVPLGMPMTEVHTMSRRCLGDMVHIFSHIRLTMRAEHIVLLQDQPPCDITATDRVASEDGTVAAVRWLSKTQLEQEGLSSGVKKIYSLLAKSKQCEKRGIKRFFRSS